MKTVSPPALSSESSKIPYIGETAYSKILELILTGYFRPGAMLQERALGHMLSMSRTPVREALKHLEIEGVVVRHANRCTMIKVPTAREVIELFSLRRILEVAAAGLAAKNGIAAPTIAALRAPLEVISRAERPVLTDHWRADEALHRGIAEAAQNAPHRDLIVTLRRRSLIANWQNKPHDLREGAMEGLVLLEAIGQRDEVRSRQLMDEHIAKASTLVLRHLVPDLSLTAVKLSPNKPEAQKPAA